MQFLIYLVGVFVFTQALYVLLANLELTMFIRLLSNLQRSIPASTSHVLGLKACPTMPVSISLSLFLVFRDRVSLCSCGCPATHFVDQAGLELRNPPASASRVLGLKACATKQHFPKSNP